MYTGVRTGINGFILVSQSRLGKALIIAHRNEFKQTPNNALGNVLCGATGLLY